MSILEEKRHVEEETHWTATYSFFSPFYTGNRAKRLRFYVSRVIPLRRITFRKVTLPQFLLLLTFQFSILHITISTLRKSFILRNLYNKRISQEFQDVFGFSREECHFHCAKFNISCYKDNKLFLKFSERSNINKRHIISRYTLLLKQSLSILLQLF